MLKQSDLYVKKETNLRSLPESYIIINSKHLTDLYIRVQMIALIKENTEHVCDLVLATGFLDRTKKHDS